MRGVILLLVAAITAPSVAMADSIDGDWCDSQNAHVQIKGSQVTTTAGAVLQGQYRRHEFSFQVPAGEADAGKRIYMMLRGEDDMTSYIIENDTPGAPHHWTRCAVKPQTS
jgi:hypothetical protein